MSSMSLALRSQAGLSVLVRLTGCVQAGYRSVLAAAAARETERQLVRLDRHARADIGVPPNGPRSLASRPVWDTAGHGW